MSKATHPRSVFRKPVDSTTRVKYVRRPLISGTYVKFAIGAAGLLASVGLAGTARAKPFEEYLKQTPIVAPLSSATWGVAGVLPRDLSNGIESAKGAGVHPDYYYWDGQIIKAGDGKYHMFMSTFSGDTNFGTGWQNSDAYHAVSQTNVLGPYVRQDYVYSNNGSHKGHNVSAVELLDGSYAVVVSEVVPFTIYKSNSLDGPWTACPAGELIQTNGLSNCSDSHLDSNVSLVARHDGKFEIVQRHGIIAIADTLCGPYKVQKPTHTYSTSCDTSVYPKRTSIPGVSNPTYAYEEDPHIWRSGGTYHIIYSGSGDRVGWHLYSADGIDWKDNGYAWSPRDYQKIFCYEGGATCSQWYKMERPGVVLQDGHPTHITWAVADVDKDNMVLPGTNHGTKVVVVSFDGVAFDNDFGVPGNGAGGAAGSGTGGAGTAGHGGGTGSGGVGGGGTGGRGGSPAVATGGASGGAATGGSNASTGGVTGSGGSAHGSGGAATGGGSGGAGAGAMTGTGGITGGSTGGTSASGGHSGATGGSGGVGTGGAMAGGSSGGATQTPPGETGNSGGCACALPGGAPSSTGTGLLPFGLVTIFLLRRRQRLTARRTR